jgi:hypothetical protein
VTAWTAHGDSPLDVTVIRAANGWHDQPQETYEAAVRELGELRATITRLREALEAGDIRYLAAWSIAEGALTEEDQP